MSNKAAKEFQDIFRNKDDNRICHSWIQLTNGGIISEAKSKVADWGIKSTLHGVKVDSGVGLLIINVLGSTLAST